MKFNRLFLGLGVIAAMAMTACSDDGFEGQENEGDGSGETRYMRVNIVSNSEVGSRADDSDFEDGLDNESKINNVRFFFFDANGNKAIVKAGSTVNSFDWIPSTENKPSDPNVTVQTEATIIINTESGDALPAKVVAICNYDQIQCAGGTLPNSFETVESLHKALMTSTIMSDPLNINSKADNHFVMTNSGFISATGSTEWETDIMASNICDTEEKAALAPVSIYVERVVAKFKVGVTITALDKVVTEGSKKYYRTGTTFEEGGKTYEYVAEIKGWNITGVPAMTNIGKVVSSAWPSTLFATGENWNDYGRNRSYWEANPLMVEYDYGGSLAPGLTNASVNTYDFTGNTVPMHRGNYNSACKRTLSLKNTEGSWTGEGNTAAYSFANAANNDWTTTTYDPDHGANNTQIIVGAVLYVYNVTDGTLNTTPTTFANWLGTRYTVDGLKTAMANYAASELFYLKNIEADGTYEYASVTPDDLTYLTKIGGATVPTGENRRYAVWATLTNDASKKIWFYYNGSRTERKTEVADSYLLSEYVSGTTEKKIDPTKASVINSGTANQYITCATTAAQQTATNSWLNGLQPAKIWTGGDTYYYLDVKHLGAAGSPAEKGVVRNHVYIFNVTELVGLGTPVYNPSEIIIPESPVDQHSYIAAQLNVLSWRIVENEVTLGN